MPVSHAPIAGYPTPALLATRPRHRVAEAPCALHEIERCLTCFPSRCSTCFGSRRVFTTRASSGGEIAVYSDCPECNSSPRRAK